MYSESLSLSGRLLTFLFAFSTNLYFVIDLQSTCIFAKIKHDTFCQFPHGLDLT